MPEPRTPWWKSGVVYQIYPRSFADGNGDGIGDLEGIRRRLDHLAWLGVDAIWLSPIYRSPMADFGYDVADHCDVDPVFGTLADADRLIDEAHQRGIRVVLDWVPNHTSDEHPWFVASRSSRDDPKRDWYLWQDGGGPDDPPNDWTAAFSFETTWELDERGERHRVAQGLRPGADPRAWTWDDATRQWYLHLFLPEQPDVNWHNPELVEAMHDVLRFWLDRGVDGFRADVIHGIVKTADFSTIDDERLRRAGGDKYDLPETHARVREIRRLLDSYPGDRMMVGEVYLLSTGLVATFYGNGDELHLAFNFPPLYAPWEPAAWRKRIERVVEEIHPVGWPTWVLSNHDNMRHRSRYGSEARARAAAVLLLTLRGTPFLYAGEELGLEDAEIPPDRRVDPGGRDGCRAPIPWDGSAAHGWGHDPWLPFPPDPHARNVEALRADPGSILHLYRRLLAARKASPALSVGDFAFLDAPESVLAWQRTSGDEVRAVAVNFGGEPADLGLDGDWVVEVASDGAGEGEVFAGSLAGDTAVVLRPA